MIAARHLHTLELPKILERLAGFCSFSASAALARGLHPATDPAEVRRRLAETTQARAALSTHDGLTIGNARDVREAVRLAARGGSLDPATLLEIRDTLNSARALQRALSRHSALYPALVAITDLIEPCVALAAEITRCINDEGEVRDEASLYLSRIRAEARTVHDRLIARLQKLVSDSATAPFLQEALITQRNGRYVLPVKADFKGRIPGVVHDQSASGMTLFVEPLVTLELNNQWRELQLAEEHEVRRVLAALSAQVGAHAEPITRTVEALAAFDLALAKAKYAEAIHAVEPIVYDDARTKEPRLVQARHPLLDPKRVVPIDVLPEPGTRALVITGPNTGGKTVALKTAGLLAAMAQCGLHLPCQRAELPVYDAIYADIGDEQSIEQSLSTFSAHMTNLCSFLSQVNGCSLVLLDELGAGTDPSEGAALARAILEHLLRAGATCMVATHYPELKAWASVTPGAANASVAFDYETLQPLYVLTIGLPGRSNAFAIAQRLGLPETILEAAQGYLSQGSVRLEEMLAEIDQLRQQSEQALMRARAAQRESEAHNDRLRQRLNQLEEERRAILEQAREEALRETEHLRAELRRLRAKLTALGSAAEEARKLEQEIEQLAEAAQPKRSTPAAVVAPARSPAIQPGDAVRVRSLNAVGEVLAVANGEADVQIGRMRMRVRTDDLERTTQKPVVEPSAKGDLGLPPAPPKLDLDLRGLTTDECLAQMEIHLDRAARAGMPFVRLIHGKGTGALRRAVRDALKSHRLVRAFETGTEGEGGDGVTVVYLNN
ncbi:MAG: endonuclease MutS2 [Anaerolineae bacterium]|nr:endonuclease MutS2 [Anaerolineae bacterium]